MIAEVYDTRRCSLGEGPLWHPERAQLFWFDINAKRLLSRDKTGPLEWQFDEHVSAAGWIDIDTLLIASETALLRFSIVTGEAKTLIRLEADTPVTRSNDGRADPFGGFWIGTMGKNAETEAGAIYRYYNRKLVQLYDRITISNAICFSPDGTTAYFADTPTQKIMRQSLDPDGWPKGAPEVFIDLSTENLNPDGAVVDSQGCLWNAQWGAHRVARYGRDGAFLSAVEFPAEQVSCPAFGGPGLKTLFASTAAVGLNRCREAEGKTYSIAQSVIGQREHRVILG